MIVKRVLDSRGLEQCNFCNRESPYRELYAVKKGILGINLMVVICDKCIKELNKKVKKLSNG